jgi:hypothetical protein
MSDRDYYEILGLTPEADLGLVDQAYWHLARKYQEQAAIDPLASGRLDDLNEAYGVIGTPRLREQYDAFRDDVLLTRGMIRPMRAKRRRDDTDDGPSWHWQAPPHAYTYATSAIIVVLAVAAAWQGVPVVLVIPIMGAGLLLSLLPLLRQRLGDTHISLPSVSLPDLNVPQVALPRLPDIRAVAMDNEMPEPARPETVSELQESTAAMIGRWRQSIGLKAMRATPRDPDTTLVEIFESEKDLEEAEHEPLSAALDILRGAGKRG